MSKRRTPPKDPFGTMRRLSPAGVRARFSPQAVRQQIRRGGTPATRAASWPEVDIDRNPAAAALYKATNEEN